MAAAIDEIWDNLDYSFLTCTICNKDLKKPKLLSCQHSFCTPCLEQRHDDVKEAKPFCCPTCQKEIQIEDNSVESIPDNYLFDISKNANEGRNDLKCMSCDKDKGINATHKCLDCGDILCKTCSDWHCKPTPTKNHLVVALIDLKNGLHKEDVAKRKFRYCDDHKVALSCYCETCRCLVCLECIQTGHNQHSLVNIQKGRETQQTSYVDKVANLERSQRDQKRRKEILVEEIADTKNKWTEQENGIYRAATTIYDTVDQMKEERLEMLKSHYEKELKYLNDLLEEETRKESRLKATAAFTQEFLAKSSDSDILHHNEDVEARVESSQRGLSKCFKRRLLTVERKETGVTQALENMLGNIDIQENVIKYKYTMGDVITRFEKKVDMDCVNGITVSNTGSNEIFLAGFRKYGGVLVLDEFGNFRRVIDIEGINNIHDIHVENSKVFLTTFYDKEPKVIKMNLNGKVTRKEVMLPKQDQIPGLGLAVDKDETIYVSSDTMGWIHRVHPGADEGLVFIRNYGFDDLEGPAYLCLTPNGELVATCNKSSNIQAYSKEGKLLWHYEGTEEGNPLDDPSGICCDEDGNIYVADNGNCRIQVIRDKKWIGNIPIDEESRVCCVPLTVTPSRDLIYCCNDKLVKIAFWELEK